MPHHEETPCMLGVLTLLDKIDTKLNKVLALLQGIKRQEKLIMATLDQVMADVQEESTVVDSLATLTAAIKAQLDAALANEVSPAAQAKVDAIFAAIEANKQKMADAILANTPAA
jgi:uncharacterized protein YoxC